jgi:two-component system, chemotaxis family, sensor kinase CheA
MDLGQYKDLFLTESQKHLEGLKRLFEELSQNPGAFDKLEEAMRIAHTLKGMAGMMSFDKLTKVSMQMEETLNAYCINKEEISSEAIKVMRKGLDVLVALVDDIRNGKDSNIAVDSVIADIKKVKIGS